jgi:transcriptional regulator with XRE-family HTH domain
MLCARLRGLRNANGMSQQALADELSKRLGKKMSPDAIGTYERGKREMSASTLAAIADIFGCTTDYLLGREYRAGEDITAAMCCLTIRERERLVGMLRGGWPEIFCHNALDNYTQ